MHYPKEKLGRLTKKRGVEPRLIKFNDKQLTVKEWSKELGLSESTLYLRLRRLPLEEALSPNRRKGVSKLGVRFKYQDLDLTISQWSELLGVSYGCVYQRILRGLAPDGSVISTENTSPIKEKIRIQSGYLERSSLKESFRDSRLKEILRELSKSLALISQLIEEYVLEDSDPETTRQ